MRFSEMAEYFDLPVIDRDQPRPRLAPISRRHRLARRTLRRPRRRRLAYVDNTFPWLRSGFRYHEALALHELAPDTLFFSMWKLEDPFPAPVHPLTELSTLALRYGITDIYGVFALFLEGLAGTLATADPRDLNHAFAGPDASDLLRSLDIALHGTIYPGGGYFPTDAGFARLRSLRERMTTMMSYVPEVLSNVPGVVGIDQALTETRFYETSDERWQAPSRLVCLFAADAPPRKGLDVALSAFAELDPSRFHLHVVGPHQSRRDELAPDLATFHGWLSPEGLRALHHSTHVFLSPVRAEDPGPAGSRQGTTDGFPTQSAADAMSSGCLLVSCNPAGDHRVLTPSVHFLELDDDPRSWRTTLERLAADPAHARAIAEAGSTRVRDRMDIRVGTAEKLRIIGID